jgi:hypothetical protein
VPKTVDPELAEVIRTELRGSDIRLMCQVYINDNERLVLHKGDTLLVSFEVSDTSKDFVIGKVLAKTAE